MKQVWISIGILVIAALVVVTIPAQSQGMQGQICLLAFEDLDANGLEGAGERRISAGVNVTLANDLNVIVATGQMEESATASRGTYCFVGVTAGQYTLTVSSAQYQPIGETMFITVMQPLVSASRNQTFRYPARPVTAQSVLVRNVRSGMVVTAEPSSTASEGVLPVLLQLWQVLFGAS